MLRFIQSKTTTHQRYILSWSGCHVSLRTPLLMETCKYLYTGSDWNNPKGFWFCHRLCGCVIIFVSNVLSNKWDFICIYMLTAFPKYHVFWHRTLLLLDVWKIEACNNQHNFPATQHPVDPCLNKRNFWWIVEQTLPMHWYYQSLVAQMDLWNVKASWLQIE